MLTYPGLPGSVAPTRPPTLSTTARRPPIRHWLALAGLALLLHLAPGAAGAALSEQELHHLVCTTAVELMLEAGQSASRASPQVAALRQRLAQVEPRLQPSLEQLLQRMDDLYAQLNQQGGLAPPTHVAFNNALLDTLSQLQPARDPAAQSPLRNLPERLDYALVLYVSRPQIGMLRPARELRDSYLGQELPVLTLGIEHDLLRDDWLLSAGAEQTQLLKDARVRWKYIAPMLKQRGLEPVPLNARTQIGRINQDLRQLRAALRG